MLPFCQIHTLNVSSLSLPSGLITTNITNSSNASDVHESAVESVDLSSEAESLPTSSPASVILETSTNDSSDKNEEAEDDYDDAGDGGDDDEDSGPEVLLDEIQPTSKDKEEGYCVLDNRLSCGKQAIMNQVLKVPCARNTRPQPLETKKELELLQEVCPEFLEGLSENEYPKLCCNYQGLRELFDNYQLPKQFGLEFCPSCYYNFRRIFCNSACSPRQNKFLRVDRTGPVTIELANKTHSLRKVEQMTYFMNENFANALYDSCLSKSLVHLFAFIGVILFVCSRHSRHQHRSLGGGEHVRQARQEVQRQTLGRVHGNAPE